MLRPGTRGIHAPWTIDNALREDASSLPAVPGKEPRWAGPHPDCHSTGALQQVWDPERLSVEIRTRGSDPSGMLAAGFSADAADRLIRLAVLGSAAPVADSCCRGRSRSSGRSR